MKDYEDEAFDELEKAQQRKVATGVTDGSKVTIDRAKLEQVLEALEELNNTNTYWWQHVDEQTLKKTEKAIITLKEALEDV
jgi:RNA-splicing ligase RtcB